LFIYNLIYLYIILLTKCDIFAMNKRGEMKTMPQDKSKLFQLLTRISQEHLRACSSETGMHRSCLKD
jgi:hypothetical protein